MREGYLDFQAVTPRTRDGFFIQETLLLQNRQLSILALKVLVRLDEKDMGTSKKGSFYYKVNPKVYQSLFTIVPSLL